VPHVLDLREHGFLTNTSRVNPTALSFVEFARFISAQTQQQRRPELESEHGPRSRFVRVILDASIDTEELIEPLRHQCTALMQKCLVPLDAQQRWVSWNALGFKWPRA
jgi:hypothetical protein